MPKPTKKPPPIQLMLADESAPFEQRVSLLKLMLNDPNPEAQAIVQSFFDNLGAAQAESLYQEKIKQLNEVMRQIEEGPRRNAAFIELLKISGATPQASVVLDDGTCAYCAVPDEELARSLRLGDRVIVDGRGRALLGRAPAYWKAGEEALFERRIDERHIEVSLRGQERFVYLAAQDLSDQIEAEKIAPGATVIVNSRQFMAFAALPPQDSLSHYRFLVKSPPPSVMVNRDIGAPPRFIHELSELVRLELTNPDLRRRYRLRRCTMKLLAGVSGSGKTLAIQALWRRMYEVMSEVTGVPIEQLPPRVFRLRLPQVLSKWLGESDKNLDRYFAEVEQMAEEKFVAPDGREFRLPVLSIMEEIDGVAHARGHDPVFDRILTTALQRLDSTRAELQNKLILFIGTTNEAAQVDRAFLRRVGGTIEYFGRLNKEAFGKVLQTHVAGLPVASNNGCAPEQIQRRMVHEVTSWLYRQNAPEHGIVELTYAGSTTPDVRHRRDFLTGSIVDRAVQQAAQEAVQAEHRGGAQPGVSLEMLMRAFDDQIRGLVEQLTEQNARNYLTLPDNVRVAALRRVPQPSLLPIELQRH